MTADLGPSLAQLQLQLQLQLPRKLQLQLQLANVKVSERNYRTILKECPEAALRSGTGMSAACTAAVKQMDDNLGGMFDYSLYVHGSVTTKSVRQEAFAVCRCVSV